MTLTTQELVNKKEARKLLNLPVKDRPDSTVFYTPPARLGHARYARYRVVFGSKVVCFQHDTKRYIYLGEYDLANFPDLVAYFTEESDQKYCESCREPFADADLTETPEGIDYYAEYLAEIEAMSADLAGEYQVPESLAELRGEKTQHGWFCFDCLELVRKRDQLTEAIAIVLAAVREAYYPHYSNISIVFGANDFISKEQENPGGETEYIGGYSDAKYLASELLARIKTWPVSKPTKNNLA